MNQTDPPAAEAEPICKFEQGCHRVVACDPGCGAAPAVFPEPPSRAAVLLEAADIAESLRQFERVTAARWSAQVSENVGILRVVEHLRRVADEEQPAEAQQQPETEACGRTESVCGTEYPPCARPAGHEEAYCRSADGNTYFLAVGYRQPAAADSEETRHTCGNCEGVDPDTCLTNPDRPAEPPV